LSRFAPESPFAAASFAEPAARRPGEAYEAAEVYEAEVEADPAELAQMAELAEADPAEVAAERELYEVAADLAPEADLALPDELYLGEPAEQEGPHPEDLFEDVTFEDEDEDSPPPQGVSPLAVQAAKQWDAGDRPKAWQGQVYGLVVHTTGGGLPAKARDKGVYHTVQAVAHYSESHGCHYINGWRGIAGGDFLQVANEREQAKGVGVTSKDPRLDQRRSIDRGRFESDLPADLVTRWRARWPGHRHSLELLPGTRTANSCYVHMECVPCVFHYDGKLVTAAEPLRPGLRFTRAQHDTVALVARDIASRNGWPLDQQWWRTPRLLGHEDLTPISRHTPSGGWDPGYLRSDPYFDWDYVYEAIERLKRRDSGGGRRPSVSAGEHAEEERQYAGGPGGGGPLAHMAFKHILLETLDPATSALVPGVVPATPTALTTPFYNATAAGTKPDATLQAALTSLIESKQAYKSAGTNLAVSLVDLSGANKSAPKYAGFNDLASFYGSSVNKITGLLGVYQLLAEANELLAAQPAITDAAGLAGALAAGWTQAGIAAKHHPQVAKILAVQPGSPPTAKIRPELVARLDLLSRGNQNGSTPIVLLKFPFIGSTMLAHGLFSPANKSGLWVRQAYGNVSYLGQTLSLPNWSAKENPHPATWVHHINAVSVAQFYTLAAQRRMIDTATSTAVLRHLQSGACTTEINVEPLRADGAVSAKCGIFRGWVHNSVYFKETATLREFVVVILTKNHTFGIMKDLFDDLVNLIP
jgi:hypothetical protein